MPLLALCMVSAPLLWLGTRALFEDDFRIGAKAVAALTVTLASGFASHTDLVPVLLGDRQHKGLRIALQVLLLGFGFAALWVVLKGPLRMTAATP